jgi:hypothetical protein
MSNDLRISHWLAGRISALSAAYDADSDWVRGQIDLYRLAMRRAQFMSLQSFSRCCSDPTDSYSRGKNHARQSLARKLGTMYGDRYL